MPWLALVLLAGCTVYQDFPGHQMSSDGGGGGSHVTGGGGTGGESVAPSWEWVSPSPATVSAIQAIWVNDEDDVWFAGAGGTILRWDGVDLTRSYFGSPHESFTAIWAGGSKDVWAAGDRSAAHWDGSTWSTSYELRDHAVTALWGASKNSVWAATDAGFAHWSGAHWTLGDQSPRTLRALWGTSADDIWAVGDGGLILHHDQASSKSPWTAVSASEVTDATHDFIAIGGAAPDDVWAVYYTAAMDTGFAHWDGQSWWLEAEVPPAVPQPGRFLGGATLAVLASDDVYATVGDDLLWHWDGTAWTLLPWNPGLALASLGGSPSAGLFIGNYEGAVYHPKRTDPLTDQTKKPELLGSGVRYEMAPLSVAPDKSVWGNACRYRFAESGWHHTHVPIWIPIACEARSADDVWVAGMNQVHGDKTVAAVAHWNGKTWGKAVELPEAGDKLRDVRFVDDSHGFAVGERVLLAWDGDTWKTLHTEPGDGRTFMGLLAFSTTDVWISTAADVVHWDGAHIHDFPGGPGGWTNWSSVDPSWSLSASGPNDVWACGAPPGTTACFHWNGDGWKAVPLETDQPATSVWARAPNDAWIITTDEAYENYGHLDASSTLHHYNGVRIDSTLEVAGVLSGIAGTSADDVWAAGADGMTLHFHRPDSTPR